MKNLYSAFAIVLLMLSLNACKTTEANYRQAYETAKEKRVDAGDSTVTASLKNSFLPKEMNIGGLILPVRTEPVGITKNGGGSREQLRIYNVAVASFRQRFNASSMRDRLCQMGYDAFLLHNKDMIYYVIAGTTQSPQEAFDLLNNVKAESELRLQTPFPYVLRAAHLVR